MTNPNPPPHLPDLIPHKITKGEINITHAPQTSPICVNDAPVANLFCNLQGVSQKKISIPTARTGHTPARKKQNRTTCHTSAVKARLANQDLLAALHVEKSFDCGAASSDLHLTVVTTDGYNARDGHNKGNTSDDDDYYPTSIVHPPPPSRLQTKKKIEPKIVLDCTFMTFLCLATFGNQFFCKGNHYCIWTKIFLPLKIDSASHFISTFPHQETQLSRGSHAIPLMPVGYRTLILMLYHHFCCSSSCYQQNSMNCGGISLRIY
jgi:hypothetical protein